MAVHDTSINFRKLIQDLAQMYPFHVSEIILSELIANALDAKATKIKIDYNPIQKILIIEDNGEGMTKDQFKEYHDFAAELKQRGTGIGFAGLGAKISFNIADRVVTETRSDFFSGGSNWYLQTNTKLVWEDLVPTEIKERGTRVEVHFNRKEYIIFKDSRDILDIIKKQYLPLLDIRFLELYSEMNIYSLNLRFEINKRIIEPFYIRDEYNITENNIHEFHPKRGNKRYGKVIFFLSDSDYPIAEDLCGVLHCTYGKVIKTDWFNQFPGKFGPRILGIAEVPDFIHFITASKTDFIKQGRKKASEFEKLLSPIRNEFKKWLKKIGVELPDIIETNEAKKLEKEIKKILEEVPELSELFGFRLRTTSSGTGHGITDNSGQHRDPYKKHDKSPEKHESITRSKPGPKFSFVDEPDRKEMSWVEGNYIFINTGYSSYKKIKSNSSAKRLHNLFAIAYAIHKFLAGDEQTDLKFIDRMMAAWGNK